MYLYNLDCKFQELIMLAKTRDAETALAVQNAFENYFLAFWRNTFILMSFFSREDKPEHPLEACPFQYGNILCNEVISDVSNFPHTHPSPIRRLFNSYILPCLQNGLPE